MFFPFLGTLGLWDCWETHYGEVAREMIARDDYIYPHWESDYFFSKPVLPLWMMAAGMLVFGAEASPPGAALGSWAEWGVRLPFAVIAIATLWAVYLIGRQLRDRAAGLAAAAVLGSSALFVCLGKQVMMDMPLVGFMTIGLAFFMRAVFDQKANGLPSRAQRGGTSLLVCGAILSQALLFARELVFSKSSPNVSTTVGVIFLAAMGLSVGHILLHRSSRRDCDLAVFYTMTALAALSKGLAVLAIVGPTVVLYTLLTFDFDVLKRSKVLLGGCLFLTIAAPWYLVMSFFPGRDDEGKTFVQRFWMHDNFNRITLGVHGDRAGLGYFIEQLAYGMFPWFSAVPLALGLSAKHASDLENVQKRRILLFVLLWALWSYGFFSISQTKFHYYIFPAVPALSILVGYWLRWAFEKPEERFSGYVLLLVGLLFAVAARDLINTPQNLVNLFTYKYDRVYPRELTPRLYMGIIVGGGAVCMLVALFLKKHTYALGSFVTMGLVFGLWVSHHHFNMLAPHWSQAHLFKTLFEEREEQEPIYAFQLFWRGETFYSRNQVIQVKDSGASQRIRALVDRPGREFILTEQSRLQTLRTALSPDKREKLHVLDRSNNKYYLCVVDE